MKKMDGLFGLLEGTLRISLTDATMMWIVHHAMDKAHGKVKSKEGVIERLNEISKFYELAVIQLEGCMKFVQEDADNNFFESCHEKVLTDLKEIKDRLQGRLQDSEMALRGKDKELRERFENELKLRQTLDVKEKELVALQNANVELERTRSDGVTELCMSSPGSREEDRDSEISELMHSVDQQVLHIEHEVIDEERNEGIDHKKIEQMGFDINILKETLHKAFGKMQNAIFLSELGPQEQQWRWTIEKDAICTLINGFVKDFKENFEIEMRKQEKQVFVSLNEHLSDLMTEVTCLRNELASLVNQNDVQLKAAKGSDHLVSSTEANLQRKIPPRPRRSLSEGDSFDNFSAEVEELERKQLRKPQKGVGQSVAKIIKNHESIIRRKSEEMIWLKRVMLPEKGCSNLTSEKDPVSLKGRIQEVIVRLDNLMKCNARLVETFGEYGGNQGEETPASQMISESDVKKEMNSGIDNMEDVWKKMNKASVPDTVNEELQNELRILKEEVGSYKFEAELREEIYFTVCSKAAKEFCSALDWNLEHFRDVCSLSEDVCSVLCREMYKEWNEKIEDYSIERLIREDISRVVSDEAIKEAVNTANDALSKIQDKSLEIAEYLVTENVYMVFFREVMDDWKKEIDACNIENLFREEIHQYVFREAMKDTCLSFMEGETRKQDKSSVEKKIDGSLEGGGEESLIENLDMLLKGLEDEEDIMISASSEVEHNEQLGIMGLDHEQLNEHEIFQELMNEDDTTFTSVRNKLEKALEQLAASKTIMRELESSLGTADCDQERVDDQKVPADIVHCQQQNEEIHKNQFVSMLTPILEFSQVFEQFELQAQEKLGDKVLRLEEMKHQLDLLVELVASIQKREVIYRTAFVRRSKNLQRAENEVDLLGDQVDALIGLLEKIYRTLHEHSPVLQQHFEVSEIMKLIQKELK